MTWRFLCWTLGLALVCPGALASAQPPPPQALDLSRPLRLDVPVPAPPPSPLDVTPTTGSSRGLRTLATCPTCPTDDVRARSPAGNAPWRIGASYTAGDAFNHVTFGLVGQRNERLPLFMSVPIGTAVGPAPPQSGANRTSDTRIRWLATIAADKALDNRQGGGAFGILGEAFLPLGTVGAKPSSLDSPSVSGRAVRGALRFRY